MSDRFTFETLKNRPEVEVFETVAFDVVERQRLRDNDTTGLYGVRVVAVVYSYNDRVCYAYG